MTHPIENNVLSCPVSVADIGEDGRSGHVEADEASRVALIARLDLERLDRLRLDYTLVPLGRGRFRLTGRWSASAAQTCGVTLEPIPFAIDEDVSIEFWTAAAWERYKRSHGDVAFAPDEDAPEIIARDEIDPGQLLEELFIVALPPFPRREDAELSWREREEPDAGPFAVLRGLSARNRS